MNDTQMRRTVLRNTARPVLAIALIVLVIVLAIVAFLSLPPTTPAHAAAMPSPTQTVGDGPSVEQLPAVAWLPVIQR